ncbi:Hemolysin C [Rickettsia bellii OSU 85-389]|uniref:Possible hemolysin C n=1 Tax=Rickettsia bellii (strain OSU 85-389) TaxID=391896 RepID=HLYC_RICB8|nr:hemolysin C [Rickettsia bellii]A8GUH1.1 RecName: Full=Possible hemolysin C [Rickettsia bellii OSU 85-389]ABV78467.1 Hemolysin C [Rickettsia bellii OSU 85-389]
MLKSSKKEDDSKKNHDNKSIFHLRKLFSPIKSLFSNKVPDDFFSVIKRLKTNSQKMTLDERNILANLLKLKGKTIEDIMVPRSDIAAIKLTTNIEELNESIKVKIPHTRTLIYDGTLDNIVGFIHIKDLFKALVTKQNFRLKKLIRKHIIAAPSMKLLDLLAKMRREKTHIAIVIDEYGGTDGLVTIEDVMEALVGRIDDEHDQKSEYDNYKVINNSTIISNARVEVEVLEEIIGEKLKDDDDDEFDTIGGLVLTKMGNVPAVGTKINVSENIEIEVTDANPRSLKQVKITLKNSLKRAKSS